VGDKVSFTLLVIKTIYMYIRSQFFQFHTRQTDSCLPIRDPKTSSLQYSLSLSLSLSLFRFYKSKPTIAKPCFKHFRERERERERIYGFNAAKEDSIAQKDSNPASPYNLQICNAQLETINSLSCFSFRFLANYFFKAFFHRLFNLILTISYNYVTFFTFTS